MIKEHMRDGVFKAHDHVVVLGTGWRDLLDDERSFAMVNTDFDFIESQFGSIVCVVEGGQRGADRVINKVAAKRTLPRTTIPARWDLLGKGAGKARNVEMRDFVEVVAPHIGIVVGLAYPAPESVGTRHMMSLIRERGWHLHIHEIGVSNSSVQMEEGGNRGA